MGPVSKRPLSKKAKNNPGSNNQPGSEENTGTYSYNGESVVYTVPDDNNNNNTIVDTEQPSSSSGSRSHGSGNQKERGNVEGVSSSMIKRVSSSKKSGLLFPVARIARYLKAGRYSRRVGKNAAVYLAAVMQYVTDQILIPAGEICKINNKVIIRPRHILLGVRSDEELNELLKDCVLPEAGAVSTQC